MSFWASLLKKYKLKRQKKQFDELYQNVNGTYLSKLDRKKRPEALNLLYGEVTFEGFYQLLQLVKPKSKEVFYDLGSGTGKALIIAAMTQNFSKLIGIETLPSLYQACEAVVNKYSELNPVNIQVHLADLLNYDFQEADVVFINATGFFGDAFLQLVERLKQLKSGSRIIITSKRLPEDDFNCLEENLYPMSWGLAHVFVYLK